jgi:hypothetical protein
MSERLDRMERMLDKMIIDNDRRSKEAAITMEDLKKEIKETSNMMK